jgi:hypothetical protein
MSVLEGAPMDAESVESLASAPSMTEATAEGLADAMGAVASLLDGSGASANGAGTTHAAAGEDLSSLGNNFMDIFTETLVAAKDFATNPIVLVGLILLVIVAGAFVVRKLRIKYREGLALMKPMERFFLELSRAATPGHDKALFAMLPEEVTKVVDKGTIRAMGRCVQAELGSFQGLDIFTFRQSKQKTATRVLLVSSAEARFSKSCCPIKVSVHWYKHAETKAPQIVSFQISPDEHGHGHGPGGKSLTVSEYLEPSEFEQFGERFVLSLLTKEPKWAYDHLFANLKKRYPEPKDLAVETTKVLRAAGGFKGSEPDITYVKGEKAPINENNDTKCLVLTYHIAGNQRNMEAEVRVCIVGLQAQVIRYQLKALPGAAQKQLLVDQETGEKTLID